MAALLYIFLLLGLSFVHESQEVISGPKFPLSKGTIEPIVLDVEAEEMPSEIVRRAQDPKPSLSRLQVRQSENTSRITAFALSNDSHNQALVHWTGYPSQVVFVLTREVTTSGHSTESWLWRSTDYGRTFVNKTDKFDRDTVLEWQYISPKQNYMILTDRIHNKIFITADEGESYTGYDTPFRPDSLTFQSSDAPGSKNGTLPLHVLGHDTSDNSLWVSQNLGPMSWIRLGRNVTRYYWRVLGTVQEPNTAVYFEEAINDTHAELRVSSEPYTTIDMFEHALGAFQKNSFVLAHEYMFVQKTTQMPGEYSSPLWVSYNRQSFHQARFPSQVVEKHYSVVDASEGQVFIAVYHDISSTHLYISEEKGVNYSLTLDYIASSSPESQWVEGYPSFDVHVVEGIVGTYIANRKDPNSDCGVSLISFDKGGGWNRITAPLTDYRTLPVYCTPPECSLHLHMDSDAINGYQAILSQDSAVGMIMALGNLGANIASPSNYSAIRVYFSHDGGFTWQEVEENFWEFQFAALGSIVAMVQRWTDTNYIRWTCTEGVVWNLTHFMDIQINVIGMLTENGEKTRHVTVFGYQGPDLDEWLVIDVNFSIAVPNQCSHPEDYYTWVPSDERPGSRCLLGEVISYERRESLRCCYIDPTYERPIDRSLCECAIEDFECDFGFERVNLNSPCTPMPGIVWPPQPPTNCPENETYSFTSGYRKVAGDRCVEGNETYFLPIVKPCPTKPPMGMSLQYDPLAIIPKQNVTFTLTQLMGSKTTTQYIWDFGDNTTVINTGYEQSRVQVHAFAYPEEYIVEVVATNEAGEAAIEMPISVLDPITNVLILPTQSHIFLVSREMFFQSNITTQYGTDHTGTVVYNWDFGDLTSHVSTASATHTYTTTGTFTITLSVFNTVSSAKALRNITVYEGVDVQHIQIASSGVIHDNYVYVGKEITFTVEKTTQNMIIPEETVFKWNVTGPIDTSYGTQGEELKYNFPQPGMYDITVVGEYDGGTFSKQRRLQAESNITGLNVSIKSALPASAFTTANIIALGDDGDTYLGPLNLIVYLNGSILVASYIPNSDGSLQGLMFETGDPGTINLTFVAFNDVQSVSKVIAVDVAAVDAKIVSDGVVSESTHSQNPIGYVHVEKEIVFTVERTSQDVIIPEETVFKWNVTGPTGTSYAAQGNELKYDFPQSGMYYITVVGEYDGGTFSKQRRLQAESNITGLNVSIKSVFPARVYATANLIALGDDDEAYVGLLTLRAYLNGSIETIRYIETDGSMQEVFFRTGNPGTVILTFVAYNHLHGVSTNITADVAAVDAKIVSSGVVRDDYVYVGKIITFTAEKASQDVIIPEGTVFKWTVTGANAPNQSATAQAGEELEYNFPQPGMYDIAVVGEYDEGTLLKQRSVQAEYDITRVEVLMNPTVLSNDFTMANVTVFSSEEKAYTGPFSLMVQSNLSVLDTRYYPDSDGRTQPLELEIGDPGMASFIFTASNDLANASTYVGVNVAGMGQFGSVRFIFKPSNLPVDYRSDSWQFQLQNSIIDYVNQTYNVAVWQVEVTIHEPVVKKRDGETTARSKRNEELPLTADIIILPTTLHSDSIGEAQRIAIDLVSKTDSGELNFIVAGSSVHVDEAILNPESTSITDTPTDESTKSTNTSPYLGLGLGLGLGLLLALGFSAVMVYVAWRYHKKYSRLQIQYSRIRHVPVQYTISQSGEMEEEEGDVQPMVDITRVEDETSQ